MRKRFLGIVLLFMIFFTVGCSKEAGDADTTKESDNIELTGNELLDLQHYSLEYVFHTDAQPYFNWGAVTKSENGYYMTREIQVSDLTEDCKEGGNLLMFYDNVSKQFVPVCNQPNCKHLDKNCNAYLSILSEEDYMDRNFIQYYDGTIYMIGYDTEDYVCLYKIAPDGSTREKYMRLYKRDNVQSKDTDSSEWVTPEVCIHRGYVYFIDAKENMPKLRRMKLGGSEIEYIYETSGERPQLYRMEPYGDYLFFQTGCYRNEKSEKLDGGIYTYNIQNGEISLLKKDAVSSYTVYDYQLYYSMKDEIRSLSILTGKDEKVLDYSNGYCNMGVDKNYIATVSFEGKIEIYDKESKALVFEEQEDSATIYFGDEDLLFGEWIEVKEEDQAEIKWKLFEKKELQKKKGAWKPMLY